MLGFPRPPPSLLPHRQRPQEARSAQTRAPTSSFSHSASSGGPLTGGGLHVRLTLQGRGSGQGRLQPAGPALNYWRRVRGRGQPFPGSTRLGIDHVLDSRPGPRLALLPPPGLSWQLTCSQLLPQTEAEWPPQGAWLLPTPFPRMGEQRGRRNPHNAGRIICASSELPPHFAHSYCVFILYLQGPPSSAPGMGQVSSSSCINQKKKKVSFCNLCFTNVRCY